MQMWKETSEGSDKEKSLVEENKTKTPKYIEKKQGVEEETRWKQTPTVKEQSL